MYNIKKIISLFGVVALVAFMLCSGCGFSSAPDYNYSDSYRSRFPYDSLFLDCHGEICPLLKPQLKDNFIVNLATESSSAQATLEIRTSDFFSVPLIYYQIGPSQFNNYTYQFSANLYNNKKNKLLQTWQGYASIDAMAQPGLIDEAKSYGYQNMMVYSSESEINHLLYNRAVKSFMKQFSNYGT